MVLDFATALSLTLFSNAIPGEQIISIGRHYRAQLDYPPKKLVEGNADSFVNGFRVAHPENSGCRNTT